MARPQSVVPGVTVTWAGAEPAARRRATRRSHPVTVRTVPVVSPLPTTEELDRVRRGADHEHLAALLAGTAAAAAPVERDELRALARGLSAQGIDRATVLLALVELDHPDHLAIGAVWWGSLDDKRALVRALLHHAGWPGDRVHDALRLLGLPVWERSGVVDPLG